MATILRNSESTTVEVSQAELLNLLAVKAQELGLLTFDPTQIQVHETDPVLGTYEIMFTNVT